MADVANAIDSKFPGHVLHVNRTVYRDDGSRLTDFDIELRNAIIQVKSGSGKGAGAQVTRTLSAPERAGRPVIVYGPDLGHHVMNEVHRRGGLATRSLDELMQLIAP